MKIRTISEKGQKNSKAKIGRGKETQPSQLPEKSKHHLSL
jgi:hypothetical protein